MDAQLLRPVARPLRQVVRPLRPAHDTSDRSYDPYETPLQTSKLDVMVVDIFSTFIFTCDLCDHYDHYSTSFASKSSLAGRGGREPLEGVIAFAFSHSPLSCTLAFYSSFSHFLIYPSYHILVVSGGSLSLAVSHALFLCFSFCLTPYGSLLVASSMRITPKAYTSAGCVRGEVRAFRTSGAW